MSAEAAEEDLEEDPDPEEGAGADGEEDAPEEPEDGQPDLEDGETVDLDGLDLGDADLDPGGGADTSGSSDGDGDGDGDGEDAPAGAWGDMYVEVLSSTTTAIIDKHGDGTEVPPDHFRAVSLDDHFDATMAKFAGSSEMEPEKALVVGTLIGVAGPVALHTDLLTEAFSDVELPSPGGDGGEA